MQSEAQIFEENLKKKSQNLHWACKYKIFIILGYSLLIASCLLIVYLKIDISKVISEFAVFTLGMPLLIAIPFLSCLMDSDKKPKHEQCVSMLSHIEYSCMAKRLRDYIVDELHRPIRQGDIPLFKAAYFYDLAVQKKHDAEMKCKALNKISS